MPTRPVTRSGRAALAVRNFTWPAVSAYGPALLGIASSIIAARGLGPSGRGSLAAIMVWPGLIIVLGGAGTRAALVVISGHNVRSARHSFRFALVVGLTAGPLLALGMGALTPVVLPHDLVAATRAYLLFVPAGLATVLLLSVFVGQGLLKEYALLSNLVPLGWVVSLAVAAAVGRLSVNVALFSHAGLNVIAFTLAVTVLRWRLGGPVGRWASLPSQSFLRFAAQAFGEDVASVVSQRADQAIMATLLTPVQLGVYVVAASFGRVTMLLGAAFQTFAFPRLLASTGSPARDAHRYIQQYLGIAVPLVLAAFFAIPQILPLIYGDGFRASVPLALILTAAGSVAGLRLLAAAIAQANGWPQYPSAAEFASAFLTVTLLVALLPRYGTAAAAWISLGAYTLSVAIVLVSLRRAFHRRSTSASAQT